MPKEKIERLPCARCGKKKEAEKLWPVEMGSLRGGSTLVLRMCMTCRMMYNRPLAKQEK